MKVKLADLSGKVIVIKSDQEEARKCYENSLKTKRGVFMVLEQSPVSDTPKEVEPLEKTMPAKSTPVEASNAEATPIEEDHRNESRVESERDRRPQPVDNVVERQIGGKVFKLGRLFSQEEQDEVAAMISRHLDAFAWIAADMPGIDPDFFVPPSYHGHQGSPCATEKEEVQRRAMPRREGRDAEVVKRRAHQGDTIP